MKALPLMALLVFPGVAAVAGPATRPAAEFKIALPPRTLSEVAGAAADAAEPPVPVFFPPRPIAPTATREPESRMPVRVLDDNLDAMPLKTPAPSIDHQLLVTRVNPEPRP